MFTENWEVIEPVFGVMELKEENIQLKNTLKHVMKERDRGQFIRGLGAGVAFTPAAVWAVRKLLEVIEVCAQRMGAAPMMLGVVAVCVLTGLVLFFCSDMVCRGARRAGELFLASLELGDEENKEGDNR